MRSDVKLGFAIGGVLLAVLIVYVLVVPSGSNTQRVTKVDTTKPPGVSFEEIPSTQAVAPPTAPPATFPPVARGNDADIPVPQDEDEVASADAALEPVIEPPPPANSREIDWAKLLNGQPVLMNPPAAGADATLAQGGEGRSTPADPAVASQPPAAPELPPQVPPLQPEQITVARAEPLPPVAPPPTLPIEPQSPPVSNANGSSNTARTHVVQANETLSSISAVAYGNPNLWPAIVKANPGIDPNRLKVGTTIKLPDQKSVQAADPQIASARITPQQPLDRTKQYRVEAGDNLHNISLKLYGKAGLSDRIYELNKQTIGPDPARLKIGQVLQLPEPPTQSASR